MANRVNPRYVPMPKGPMPPPRETTMVGHVPPRVKGPYVAPPKPRAAVRPTHKPKAAPKVKPLNVNAAAVKRNVAK